MRRRDVLKLAAGACVAGAAPLLAAKEKRIPIGLQLYAVRGAFGDDVPGTLEAVAKLGYEGVEFWGYGGGPAVFKGKTADEFRTLLDGNGLKCCGMHLNLPTLLGDELEKTVEVNRKLGNRFLIVAAAREQMESPESVKAYARMLSEAASKAKRFGMRVGYHCHPFDFKVFDGGTAWDLLFSEAAPEVVMQLDIGNCAGGGGEPLAILKKFPGRATTLHVKEYRAARLEAGSAVWKEIFTLCETKHKTEWYIVEMGDREGKGLEEPRRAIETLRAMGKGRANA